MCHHMLIERQFVYTTKRMEGTLLPSINRKHTSCIFVVQIFLFFLNRSFAKPLVYLAQTNEAWNISPQVLYFIVSNINQSICKMAMFNSISKINPMFKPWCKNRHISLCHCIYFSLLSLCCCWILSISSLTDLMSKFSILWSGS